MEYNVNCKKCNRLNHFLLSTKEKYPTYFCKPIPAFGEKNPGLLIVGLAPGMHGANNTGRPFTGDHAGILLYETLYKFGFSNKPARIFTRKIRRTASSMRAWVISPALT